MNRLALGTVQFGLPYGVANSAGQVGRDEAARILETAQAAGIDTLDTAVAYGSSEERLGEIGVRGWRIVSKLPEMPADVTDVGGWVERLAGESLARLRVDKLHALLLHRPQQLLEDRGELLYRALCGVRDAGVADRVGVSIYAASELDTLMARHDLELVQAPFNVIDRSLRSGGWLDRFASSGIAVHTRSAFLQGLLLMPKGARPAYFERWSGLWERWDRWLAATSVSPLQAALSFVLATPGIDRVVVGVDSAAQLREILKASQSSSATVPDDVRSDDPDLVNPARWRVA